MRAAMVTVLLAGAVSGCGYAVIQGARPFGVDSIHVASFEEATPVGLSPELTRGVAARLARSGTTLARHPGGPVLRGVIRDATTTSSPTNVGAAARVPAYQISVRVEVALEDATGKVLWATTVEAHDDFLTAEEPLVTEANRRRALTRLSDHAADTIHQRLRIAGSVEG